MHTGDGSDPSLVPLEYARPMPSRRVARPLLIALLVILGLAVVGSIPFPPSQGARELANRVKCASNMRLIAQALQTWANDHGGRFPDQLADVLEEDLQPQAFICPDTNDVPAAGPTTRALAAAVAVPGHNSYVYVGKGIISVAPPDVVLLYEPASNHHNKGMNVLFVDGHVDFFTMQQAQPLLKQVSTGSHPIRLP